MSQEIAEIGSFLVPGHGVFSASQWLEDGIYDTVSIAAGAVTAGTEYDFFTTLTSKDKGQTNMVEQNKLPEGWELIIMKMGLEVCPMRSNPRDVQLWAERSYIQFETGNSKIRRRGPTWLWPIGFGMYSMYTGDEGAVAGATGLPLGNLQIGTAAATGAPTLLIPIRLSPRMNFKATLVLQDSMTFASDFRMRMWLYGYLSRPVQ
ncbi:MAG: hypothetical protein ACYS1A_18075 [Planctomycetota bacterium]|jgi:hypothetical protein